MGKATMCVVSAVGLLFLGTGPAYAYLDPGTGSMILQGLIAGIAGGLVVLRLYWGKVKKFFSRDVPQSDRNASDK